MYNYQKSCPNYKNYTNCALLEVNYQFDCYHLCGRCERYLSLCTLLVIVITVLVIIACVVVLIRPCHQCILNCQ